MRRDLILYVGYIVSIMVFAILFWHNKTPWDPCAYMETGKRIFGFYTYYEALRAPITSIFYGIFGLYGFFVVSLALLGYAVHVFSRKRGISPLLFLVLLVPALSWPYYVEGGSEILALAFLLLGAAYSERIWAGILFSLAFLSRYLYLAFVPFFLPWKRYRGNMRLLGAHLLGFAVPVLMWSALQWVVFGHPLASYIDFIYVNAYSHGTSLKPPRFDYLLQSTLPTTVLAIPGFDKVLGLFFLVALYFAVAPNIQWPRFYIPLLLPAALATVRWIKDRRFAVVLAIVNIFTAFFFVYPMFSWGNSVFYDSMANEMDGNCVYISNVWVPLVCEGKYAMAPPSEAESDANIYFDMLKNGYRAAVMMGVGFPAYMEDINKYIDWNVSIKLYDRFFLAGDGCISPEHIWDLPDNSWRFYSERLKAILSKFIE